MPWIAVAVYNATMPIKDSEKRKEYYRQYRKDTEYRTLVSFRYGRDDDIIEYLKNCPNKPDYIRGLIRADMDR